MLNKFVIGLLEFKPLGTSQFSRVSYTEAIEILQGGSSWLKFEYPVEWGS